MITEILAVLAACYQLWTSHKTSLDWTRQMVIVIKRWLKKYFSKSGNQVDLDEIISSLIYPLSSAA